MGPARAVPAKDSGSEVVRSAKQSEVAFMTLKAPEGDETVRMA
jgi:hypothetical protein